MKTKIFFAQVINHIKSDEAIEDKPLVSHFNDMSLKGDGDGQGDQCANCVETNDCGNVVGKCCQEEAKDDEANENTEAEGEISRIIVSGSGNSMGRRIPRRLPIDSKKKNQLLAALKSIDSNKRVDLE